MSGVDKPRPDRTPGGLLNRNLGSADGRRQDLRHDDRARSASLLGIGQWVMMFQVYIVKGDTRDEWADFSGMYDTLEAARARIQQALDSGARRAYVRHGFDDVLLVDLDDAGGLGDNSALRPLSDRLPGDPTNLG
jgi:hypothetical protein